MPARSISLASPATVNGAPRSETKMKGDCGLALQYPQCSQFITEQRVRAGGSTLDAANVKRRAFKFHIRPLQFAKLTGPQAMPEANQDHCAVPGTVTVALGSFDQLLDFALCQMLTRS